MKSFEPLSLPLSRHQSGGSRRPPPPPPSAMSTAASPPRLPQSRRGSRGMNGDRSTLLHLRRSELAGWRTKSVFPSQREGPNPNCFLPILKLRGLPFFCSRKHVCQWLGDLSIYLKDLIFVLEVDSLTTGFGLVTFHTPQAAYDAWQKLHKAPIVGKRFVEVFALFPPHCPLSRRADTVGSNTTSNNRAEVLIAPPPSNENAPMPPGGGLIPDPHQQCCFCGFSYWQHGDHGVAAFATLRLRRLMDTGVIAHSPGLMHTAFLKVPALLFQDAGAVSRHEVELFDPDLWRERSGESLLSEPGVVSLDALENNNLTIWNDRSTSTFFDLLQVESYHMRILISEVANILVTHQNELQSQRINIGPPNLTAEKGCNIRKQPPGTLSIADIGNRLSTRARAYLFLTETKLKNVLETFEEFFILSEPIGPYSFYSVSLTPQLLSRGSMLIWNMQPYQLSRRGRRRETNRKATSGDVLSLQPLERRSTQIASNQISYGRLGVTQATSQSQPPLVSLSRATSCAVSRVPDNDVDTTFTLSPSIRHQRLQTPPTPMIIDSFTESTPPDIFSASGLSLSGGPPPEEPLSQVLVDFIKSAGLESIMSADSTASSSRRLSQWTTAVPPGMEDVPPLCAALTPASRSRTCPGCRHDLSVSTSHNTRQVASPVAKSQNVRPSWMLMSPQAQDRPTGLMDPVIERQQLISNLLKQRDEVEAKIEEALNCPTPLAAMSQTRPTLSISQTTSSKGLGTFANDLMPVDNFPLVFDANEDELIESTYADISLDPLEDFLLNERAQHVATRRQHETVSGNAGHSRLTPIEVSEILRALDH